MRMIFLVFATIFSQSSFAQSSNLSCSANGTNVFYVNGVLTRQQTSIDIERLLQQKIFPEKTASSKLDKQSKVKIKAIWNPSFGIINDGAELFTQMHRIKTGADSGTYFYSLYSASADMTNLIASIASPAYYFVSTGSKLLGYDLSPNYRSLISIAKESEEEAKKKAQANPAKLYEENIKLNNGIAKLYSDSIKSNQKVIFIAHSQGNAALESGVRTLLSNSKSTLEYNDTNNYLKKFSAFMHVASPVAPINQLGGYTNNNENFSFKTDSMLFDVDKVISLASTIDFGIPPAQVTHKVMADSILEDPNGHGISEIYLSDKLRVVPVVNTPSTILQIPKEIFQDKVFNLATRLENNCAEIKINITPISPGLTLKSSSLSDAKFEYSYFTGLGNTVTFKASDLSDFGSETEFQYRGLDGTTKISNEIVVSIPFPTGDNFTKAHLMSVYAKNKVTGNERYFTIYVSVPLNRAPQKISKWYAACQSGGTRPDGTTRPEGIANGNLLWFYADFADESFGNTGRTFLDGDQTIGVSTFEFYSENIDYMISDGMGGEITVKTPSNPCEVDTPVSLYGRSE